MGGTRSEPWTDADHEAFARKPWSANDEFDGTTVDALIRRIDALKALVKSGCLVGDDLDQCPWCLFLPDRKRGDPHALSCPAFTPTGEVR